MTRGRRGTGPEPTRRRRRPGAARPANIAAVPVVGSIPSPSFNGIHVGPFDIRIYGLCYVLAVLAAVAITTRRWEAQGGSRELVQDVALWGFPAGIIGGRLYFLATSWNEVPDHWWGPFAVWEGGLGIWGGIALGTRGRDLAPAPRRRRRAALPGRRGAGAARGAGDRARRQLLQPGALRAPDLAAVGPRDRPRAPARALRRQRHLPPHLPLRDRLEPGAGRLPGVARATAARSARPGSSRSTSPATRPSGSSRSCCASTRPSTSSACA